MALRHLAVLLTATGLLAMAWGQVAVPQEAGRSVGVQTDSTGPASAPPARNGQKWAIIIGVGDYEDPGISDLPNAVNDAKAIRDRLVGMSDGFPKKNVLLLTDSESADRLPKRNNIMAFLKTRLGLLGPEDTVLVYFAGHGSMENGALYLLPRDAAKSDVVFTGFPFIELARQVEAAPAQRKVLILDACHSGAGRADDRMSPDAIKAMERDSKGMITLSSCEGGQVSNEMPNTGNGAFTWFLLKGLEGAADQNHDGVVTATELFSHTQDVTSRWASENRLSQKPWFQGNFGGQFVLARLSGSTPPPSNPTEKPKTAPAITGPVKYVMEQRRPRLISGGKPSNITKTFQNRFTDNDDGTVSDKVLGVEWQKTPPDTCMTFEDAMQYCAQLTVGEKSGWYLPRLEQILSLTKLSNGKTMLDTDYFDGCIHADRYWTNSVERRTYSQHQTVLHSDASVVSYNDLAPYAVRAVRNADR